MPLARNIATVGFATLVSRLLGFIRDMLIAALLGAGGLADAFFIAFQVANLARRLLAEGALNAALVPLYLKARESDGETGASAFAGRLIGTAVVALSALAAVSALLMPAIVFMLAPGFAASGPRADVAVELARLMLPYLVFAGPLAVAIGVLNANGRFALAAFATAVFNATMLIVLAVLITTGMRGSAASARLLAGAVGVAGLSQLVLIGIAIRIGRVRIAPIRVSLSPEIRRMVMLAGPGLITAVVPQLTVVAGAMVASASPSAVSWLYYANRLIELPLGVVGVGIGTVLVPTLSQAVRDSDPGEAKSAQSRGLEFALGLALPAAIALIVLARPIVQVLFQRGAFDAADTAATAAALAALACGLPGHVLVKVFAPACFAREDTATPMRAALAGLAVAVAVAVALFPVLGHVGVAIGIALSGWAGAAMLGWLVFRRIGFAIDAAARRRLPRIVLAALGMGVVVELAWIELSPAFAGRSLIEIAGLALMIVLGLASYGALLCGLGVVRLRDLIALTRRQP